jgi:isopentenyldiphosphate isomerase
MTTQRLDMLVDLVDSSDKVIGTAVRRQVFQQHAGFRVSHVFIFNSAGDLLLQEIAPGLRHPGQWGSSVAAYVQAGESYRTTATRKLQDELGVLPSIVKHGKTSMIDQGSLKFIELFTGSFDGPFAPNPGDIRALEFVPLPKILAEHSSGSRTFTVTFLHLLDFYLHSSSMGP